jgi:hypothetical protein
MTLMTTLRSFLIALWLGAAVFFSAAVAQSAFAVLPSREMAGAVVNKTLAILNYSGIIIGLILLATSIIKTEKAGRLKLWIEQGLLLFLTAACAFGQFVIGARLHNIREQIGRPIDELAADDPLRAAFGALHGYSVMVLAFAMLAALVVYFLMTRKRTRNDFIR